MCLLSELYCSAFGTDIDDNIAFLANTEYIPNFYFFPSRTIVTTMMAPPLATILWPTHFQTFRLP